jgi:hypothetical protein
MAVVTIGRLSEEILKILLGGDIKAASNISKNEVKISIGQVLNNLLKIDYLSTNLKTGELIPNGSVLATYENIACEKWNNKSRCSLPIKPMKLPRGMGVWSVYPSGRPDDEFIPLQMGQSSLIKSQPMINELFGQIGMEVLGDKIVFTKNVVPPGGTYTVDMRLVVMDISQYGDWDILPVLPEMEWQIKQEVFKLYGMEPLPDMLVDSTSKEQQDVPVKEQQQTN